jgi:hypothetical protein
MSKRKIVIERSFVRRLTLPDSGGEYIDAHDKQQAKTTNGLPWIQPRGIPAYPVPKKRPVVNQRDRCSKKTGKTSNDSNQRY